MGILVHNNSNTAPYNSDVTFTLEKWAKLAVKRLRKKFYVANNQSFVSVYIFQTISLISFVSARHFVREERFVVFSIVF